LEEATTTDAVVIGAGICGLKMARALHRHGLHTILLEGGRVGDGASARNQGSINHGAALSYAESIQRYGRAQARQLFQLGLENQRLLRNQIDEYRIDCDYVVDGYTFLVRRDVANWESTLASYRTDCALLREDGFAVAWLDEVAAQRVGGNPLFAGGYTYLTDAQFHSGKFLLGLAEQVARLPQVTLYEQSRVLRIQRTGTAIRVTTGQGSVSTSYVFLALNALAPQQAPAMERGLRAERGQAFVTQPLPSQPCRGGFGTAMAWWRDIPAGPGRFRLLFGGGRTRHEPDSLFPQFTADGQPHPLLESEGFRPSVAHQQRLDAEFAKLFPQLSGVQITHRWGGLQSFTADDLPQVGLFDKERQIYGVAGLCGRGNCYSDVGAEYVVAQAIGATSLLDEPSRALIVALMRPLRSEANWGVWQSLWA
jgi:gamma-glutamylputrescine oxidase